MPRTSSLLAAVLAVVPCVRAAAPDGPRRGIIESTTWSGALARGGSVSVDDDAGDVHVRPAPPGHDVELLSVLQRPSEQAPGLRVEAKAEGGSIAIVVLPPDAGDAVPGPLRADLTLRVPEDAALRVRTRAGAIDVKGHKGDLDVASVSGAIRIHGAPAEMVAESQQGAVTAILDPFNPAGRKQLRTATGAVAAWVRDGADADVKLATSEEISTDFTLRIEHRDAEEPSKLGTARLGKGGAVMTIDSKEGHVSLRRLPRTTATTTEEND